MAFKVKFGGADDTVYVSVDVFPKITWKYNERSTATLQLEPGAVPAFQAATEIYDVDGTTLIFGGFVTNVATNSLEPGSKAHKTTVQCIDYMLYADWCTWTKVYTANVTLKTILTDLIAGTDLAGYGVTLDAAQDTGPTFAASAAQPLAMTRMLVSDILRQLATQCSPQRVIVMSPLKALRMLVPSHSTLPAPWDVSDATPNVASFDWTTSSFSDVPANFIELICGPTGNLTPTQSWIYAGSFPLDVDVAALPGGWNAGGVFENGAIFRTLSGPGGGGYYNWDATAGPRGQLTLGSGAAPSVGTVITFVYTAVYPFSVFATTGASPRISRQFEDTSQLYRGPALLEAQGLLAEQNQPGMRNVTYVSWKGGIRPAQVQNCTLTSREFSGASLTIQQVDAEYTEYTDARGDYGTRGLRLWKYTVQAIETTVPQGTWMDQLRALVGGPGGSGTIQSASLAVVSPTFPDDLYAHYNQADSEVSLRGRNTGLIDSQSQGPGIQLARADQSYVGGMFLNLLHMAGGLGRRGLAWFLSGSRAMELTEDDARTASTFYLGTAVTNVLNIGFPGAPGTTAAGCVSPSNLYLSAKIFERGLGNALGDWPNYTPAAVANLTVGNGSLTGKSARAGNIIAATITFVVGSTTVVGTNPVFGLPIASNAPTTLGMIGWWNGFHAGSGQFFQGWAFIFDSTSIQLVNATGGAATTVTATAPFTWAAGDQLWITLMYETP